MNILTLLVLDLIVAIPAMAYYYQWGILNFNKKGISKTNLLSHIKNSYLLTGFACIYIPALLMYFLYIGLLKYFPIVFLQLSIVMIMLIVVFEYVNYNTYSTYEKERIEKRK